MNNKPITARVKSGMFKTKEPLLNVGPAGVDGNNKTRTMPSPSKMKGYAMKSSPFKQNSQAEKNVDEAVENETSLSFDGAGGAAGVRETTTTIPGEKGTPDVITEPTETFTGEKATGEKAKEWAKQNEYCKGKPKGTPGCSGFHKYEGGALEKGKSGTPDEVVKTKVKGDTYRKSEGDAQTPYERRQALRAAKRVARAQKSEQRKTDRLDRKEGTATKTKKQQRIDRKRTQIKTNKAVADAEAKNVINQAKQNRSTTSTKSVRGADVKNTAADYDKDVQLKNLDSGTTKSAFTPKKVNTDIGFEARNVKSGFFKKKSPMKMNYFKK
jgi:hypothetical protein